MKKLVFGFIFCCLCLPSALQAQHVKTGACISYDGKIMIYTAIDNGKLLFYQSLKDAAWKWEEGVLLNSLNSYFDTVNIIVKDPFLTYDGNELYFALKINNDNGFDIYHSQLKNGEWQKPEMLTEIFTNEDEESPSLTADNKNLYFTRKPVSTKALPDDEYCRTIYRCARDMQGNWQKPQEVKITDEGCNAYPLILPDGKTLLFSSSKLPQKKKQKYDIFYVKENTPGVWGAALPIDAVNTEANEIAPIVDLHAKQLYCLQVEQLRKETIAKLAVTALPTDITNPTYTTLNGKISDLDNKTPIAAKVTIINPVTLKLIDVVESDIAGNFKFMLINGVDYKFDFYSPGYSKYSRYYYFNKTNYNHIENDVVKLFKDVKLRLDIYDKEAFNPINATITVIEDGNDKKYYDAVEKDIVGQFTIKLPVGKKYKIKIEDSGYYAYTFDFDVSQTMFYDEFEEDIALVADRDMYEISVKNLKDTALKARVEIVNANLDEWVNSKDLSKGVFGASLRKNNTYNITVNQKGYSFDSRSFYVNPRGGDSKINVKLIPLAKQVKIALPMVTFTSGSVDISTESYYELDRLAELMLNNPEITIEIGAYTHNNTDDAYNNRLANNQARSVAEYLILRGGITKDRIIPKGYGKTAPLNVHYTGDSVGNKDAKQLVWFTVNAPAKGLATMVAPVPASGTNGNKTK